MIAPPPEAPEPYADYEVSIPAAPALHLLVTARATADGVCLTWEGAADGTALGSLGALGALLGHPQELPPSGNTAPTPRT